LGLGKESHLMLPLDTLSSVLVADSFLSPDDLSTFQLLDYEAGPIALNDPTEGLSYQDWTLRYFPTSGNFSISSPNTPATVILTVPDVTEMSFSFDQNGNPFITYVQDGEAKFWWFDPSIPGTTISLLPANTLTPRCCHDDKRELGASANFSDILLCYVNGGALKYRQERERYTVERTLDDPFLHPRLGLPAVLKKVGMSEAHRVQWLCDLANPIDWCGYVNDNYGN
jgi:hypothetical protein